MKISPTLLETMTNGKSESLMLVLDISQFSVKMAFVHPLIELKSPGPLIKICL